MWAFDIKVRQEPARVVADGVQGPALARFDILLAQFGVQSLHQFPQAHDLLDEFTVAAKPPMQVQGRFEVADEPLGPLRCKLPLACFVRTPRQGPLTNLDGAQSLCRLSDLCGHALQLAVEGRWQLLVNTGLSLDFLQAL